MVIFNSYVKLPEGTKIVNYFFLKIFYFTEDFCNASTSISSTFWVQKNATHMLKYDQMIPS